MSLDAQADSAANPFFIVVMGIAGCGKTEVASRLAAKLDGAFLEADLLHSSENVERMRQGIGLTDENRWPWLTAVADTAQSVPGRPIVIACSVLKRRYRDFLNARLGTVRYVYLHGPRDVIEARLASRLDHFATASLLESQLAALEPPAAEENAVHLDVRLTLDELTESAARHVMTSA